MLTGIAFSITSVDAQVIIRPVCRRPVVIRPASVRTVPLVRPVAVIVPAPIVRRPAPVVVVRPYRRVVVIR